MSDQYKLVQQVSNHTMYNAIGVHGLTVQSKEKFVTYPMISSVACYL